MRHASPLFSFPHPFRNLRSRWRHNKIIWRTALLDEARRCEFTEPTLPGPGYVPASLEQAFQVFRTCATWHHLLDHPPLRVLFLTADEIRDLALDRYLAFRLLDSYRPVPAF